MKTIIDILRRSRKSSMSDAARIIIHYPLSIINLLLLLAVTTSCERRELYVYGDEFRSVELNVDWRKYKKTDPDGMTSWFYPLGNELKKSYRNTTSSVRQHMLYLPGGLYDGVVIDYSPEEYGRQQFLDLDSLMGARVEATPASYQPDTLIIVGDGVPKALSDTVNAELFSDAAWTDKIVNRAAILPESGLYTVANEPEEMALDTLSRVVVDQGEYGNYIPWKEKETYQTKLIIKKLYADPVPLIWKLRVRVWIKSGFNYLWKTPASLAGLSDGHYLPQDKNTDRSCLLRIDEWETERTGENSGYISVTLSTFGLRPESVLPTRVLHLLTSTRAGEVEPDSKPDSWYSYYTGNCEADDMRLNLAFTLRDHATTRYFHFNVGQMVVSYDEQRVLRLELGPDSPFEIILPFVPAYDGAGFDAKVTPWVEGANADVSM